MSEEHRSKGVIFDLDGVLLDSREFHQQSWVELANRKGWEFSDDLFKRTFGMQSEAVIREMTG